LKAGRWKAEPRECQECELYVRDEQEAVLVEKHTTEVERGVYHLKCITRILEKQKRRARLSDYIRVKQLEMELGVF
jgi:hypothetical protein